MTDDARETWRKFESDFRIMPDFRDASRKSYYEANALLRDDPGRDETLTQAYARLMREKAERFREQSRRYRNNPVLAATADAIEEAAEHALRPLQAKL